jgi:3-hydroxybutyrate dehydrogenase
VRGEFEGAGIWRWELVAPNDNPGEIHAAAIKASRRATTRSNSIRPSSALPAENHRLVTATAEKPGSVDILVNNAAVRHFNPVEKFETEHWDESIAVNLSSPFHLIKAAIPFMRKRNWGRIVTWPPRSAFSRRPIVWTTSRPRQRCSA